MKTEFCIAITCLFCDVLIFHGLLSGLLILFILLWFLPRALFSLFGKHKALARKRFGNLLIFSATVVIALGVCAVNNHHARTRAEIVANACQAYQHDHGEYPSRLPMLVPGYLETIPRAKYALTFSQFGYRPDVMDPVIIVHDLPPFGRSVYHIATGNWLFSD